MSFSDPALETDARPASLGSHLSNAFNQWKSPSLTAQAGQQAPSWELRDVIYNRALSKSILLGDVVAMVFGGTWCIPCQWEMPYWKELQKTYANKKFKVVGIFLDFKESVPPFVKTYQLSSSFHCCAATEKIKWDYNVNPTGRVPFLALITRGGILNGTLSGYHSKDAYEAAIKPLL